MKKLIIASNNKHKIKEFKEMFNEYEVMALEDIGYFDDIEENGETFLDNALIKARAVIDFLNKKGITAEVIADDSGLCVEALNGEPGVYSARYAGEHGKTEENRQKLLRNLENVNNRNAFFCCCLVKMDSEGNYVFAEGKTYGKIIDEYRGKTDFGYDCIFYSNDLNKTFGEASDEEKNSVSHRGRAIRELRKLCNL